MAILEIKRGDTFRRSFVFADAEGTPIDLTGATARFAAKVKDDDEVVVFCAPDFGDVDGGEVSIDGPNGVVSVHIDESLMNVEPGVYEADLELSFPGGDVKSTDTFRVKVIRDIAR